MTLRGPVPARVECIAANIDRIGPWRISRVASAFGSKEAARQPATPKGLFCRTNPMDHFSDANGLAFRKSHLDSSTHVPLEGSLTLPTHTAARRSGPAAPRPARVRRHIPGSIRCASCRGGLRGRLRPSRRRAVSAGVGDVRRRSSRRYSSTSATSSASSRRSGSSARCSARAFSPAKARIGSGSARPPRRCSGPGAGKFRVRHSCAAAEKIARRWGGAPPARLQAIDDGHEAASPSTSSRPRCCRRRRAFALTFERSIESLQRSRRLGACSRLDEPAAVASASGHVRSAGVRSRSCAPQSRHSSARSATQPASGGERDDLLGPSSRRATRVGPLHGRGAARRQSPHPSILRPGTTPPRRRSRGRCTCSLARSAMEGALEEEIGRVTGGAAVSARARVKARPRAQW